MKNHYPCHKCGEMTHIEDLDGKDDGTGDFTILECGKCYGPGYASTFSHDSKFYWRNKENHEGNHSNQHQTSAG